MEDLVIICRHHSANGKEAKTGALVYEPYFENEVYNLEDATPTNEWLIVTWYQAMLAKRGAGQWDQVHNLPKERSS